MINKILLRMVMLFNPLLQKSGVDTYQLYQILRIKLIIDNRRPKAMFARKRVTATGKSGTPLVVNIITLLLGIFIGTLLFLTKMPLVGQTFYFTIFMILMLLTLVTDFTTVLIDARDQYILLPRPVDDRTLAVSRILHITIYVLRIALLQGLPGIIMAGIADQSWLSSLIFLIQVIEATFLAILFVNLIYLMLARSVNPQRFKDLINYFQIAFSTLIFAVYYLLPRLVDISAVVQLDLLAHWWAYVLPPVWIAALNNVLIHPAQANIITSLLAIAGITLPVAGLWLVVKVLAPGFNKKLTALATSDDSSDNTIIKKPYKPSVWDKIANVITPDPVENAGFRITWKLASRSRDFKMKAYPAFAYVPIMFLYFTFSGRHGGMSQKVYKMQHGASYVFLIYLSIIVLSTILSQISQSEKFKASWVYYALPIDKPGKILSGMYKAIVTVYFLPFCLLLTVAMVCVWGPDILNDVILAFLISIVYGILIALFAVKGLPFSKPVTAKQAGGRAVTNLVAMGLIGALGYGHYLLVKYEMIIWILIVPAALITWLMLYYYRRQTWESIEMEDI